MKLPNIQSPSVTLLHYSTLLLLAALLLFSGLPLCLGQGTLQITFDGSPLQAPGTATLITNYSETGMLFTPIDSTDPASAFVRQGGGVPGYPVPDNGTAYLQAGLGSTLMFSFSDGSLFGLTSVDLAGYSDVVPDFTVEFVGYLFNGGTVSTTFSGSGITFQTFYFDSRFTGLTRVEIPNEPWSLDNLVISVPEPNLWQFTSLALGLAAAGAFKRKRS